MPPQVCVTDGAVGGGSSMVLLTLEQGTTTMAKKHIIKTETVGTKRGRLIVLLKREQGASLAEMVDVTEWQAHTVRAALTGLKKTGHVIESAIVDGTRRYTIVESNAA